MSPINWKAHSIVTDVYQECTASQSPKPSKMSAAPAPATWISKNAQDPSSRRLIWNLPEAQENDPQAKRFCRHGQGGTPRLPPRCWAKEVPAGSFTQGSRERSRLPNVGFLRERYRRLVPLVIGTHVGHHQENFQRHRCLKTTKFAARPFEY
jgi:hypothetical protein